jgi:hypothetical protein
VKDNVTLSYSLIGLELSIVVTGFMFVLSNTSPVNNHIISGVCGPILNMSTEEKFLVDKCFSHLNPEEGELDLKFIVSILIVQAVTISIIMLQRT